MDPSAANISYWLNNSLPIGYQNQSSAWFLGGNNISFNGHGHGTLNGNGQIWYDYTKGVSNIAGRPHALTISKTNNATFTGLRFVQSQMWTMAIVNSSFVDLNDIYVSSTSNDSEPARNTDGADTIYSHHINFRRWEVTNDDDSIAIKANSSDILIEDSTFYGGLGVAIGSIGQYPNRYETVERVLTRNCVFNATRMLGYIKTWTGIEQGFPPNGGGGGTGFVRDVAWTNSKLIGLTESPAEITQCTTFSGAVGECDTSTLQISNITWSGLYGTMVGTVIADLSCSGAAPCENLAILESNITSETGEPGTYSCHAVNSTKGFFC
uniref:Pectin lyase-like protein n=1 Tax=Mycena chlorophos TaxID=658473 RepID=A0ABQ0LEB7_MYCCL|nr:pectin lyase-like protein [Mycena chlorophos]